MTSSTVMRFPDISRALEGQLSTQRPQSVQIERSRLYTSPILTTAPFGQTRSQMPHPTHRLEKNMSCGLKLWDSGLLHHGQCSGQPLRKTVVRRPGPSLVDILWMLYTMPSISFVSLLRGRHICMQEPFALTLVLLHF